MGKIVSFINQKGGVGKTTTCVNMASYLAVMGKRVLLLDLDPQGNASSSLGVEKEGAKTIYNVIVDDNIIEEVILKSKVENLDLIPSSVDLAGAEIELVQFNNREKIIKKILAGVKNSYDYICIDCPPSLGLLTVNALTASDSVIIPIQCEYFALEGLTQLMYTIKLVKKHELNPGLDIEGVVLTMKDSRSNLGNSVADDINKYFGPKVFDTIIPRNIRLAEAPSYGEPICLYDPKCNGAFAYKLLTEEFLKRNEDKPK